jgi:hypothetical protein
MANGFQTHGSHRQISMLKHLDVSCKKAKVNKFLHSHLLLGAVLGHGDGAGLQGMMGGLGGIRGP